MKKLHLIGLLSVLAPNLAFAGASGFVTPTEMTITFTSIAVITSDNRQITLLSGSYPTTFTRAADDFAAISMGAITAPEGRFIGVRVCYDTARTVKLNGTPYNGMTANGIVDGTPLYSVGTVSTANNSISSTLPGGGATTLTGYTVGNGTNNCSDSYFATPVCVSTDASHCSTGDNQVDPGTTVPNVNIMLDLFNSVAVDPDNMTLDNHIPVYPYPTIGRPGAAVHLTAANGGTGLGNISALFGNDQKLLYAAGYMVGDIPGFCGGNGFVTVTAAPAGSFMNPYGPTAVETFTNTSGVGLLQFVAGNCGTGTTCTSSGINVVTNILQDVTNTTNNLCVVDTAATPSKLGFTYTAGPGPTLSATTPFTIKKWIDPGNIMGHCASAPCGSY